jgi:hypothetical protein
MISRSESKSERMVRKSSSCSEVVVLFLGATKPGHRSGFFEPIRSLGAHERAHTGPPSPKTAHLPEPVVAIGVMHDGGIIGTPEVIAAKPLMYDGGLFGKVYQKNVDAEFAMTYAMTADYSVQFNAQTYLLNW